jgi:hypothetical protein
MTTDADINAAIALLRSQGYSVTLPRADEWQAPKDLWLSSVANSITLASFRDRLNHPHCPERHSALHRKIGKSGRLLMIRPTAALLEFLTKPSQPGKRLK